MHICQNPLRNANGYASAAGMAAILMGDGIADDADAVEALFTNSAITFPADAPYSVSEQDGCLRIEGGSFLIGRKISPPNKNCNLSFVGCHFIGDISWLKEMIAFEVPLR